VGLQKSRLRQDRRVRSSTLDRICCSTRRLANAENHRCFPALSGVSTGRVELFVDPPQMLFDRRHVVTRQAVVQQRNTLPAILHAVLVVCETVTILTTCPAQEVSAQQPDVWVVSTRCLPTTCLIQEDPAFTVERLVPAGQGRHHWELADLGEMLSDPTQPLTVFIHGNRYDSASAKQQGLALSHRISRMSFSDTPVRTVIFSWPSQKQGCLIRDGRSKYQRCYTDAHYLAALLNRVDPRQPVSIVGYSFGALIALEAFEDLCRPDSGGSPCDLVSLACRPGTVRVVLVAPAVRSDALAPCGPYRESLACVDRLTVIINSRDEALRFFPLLDRHSDLPALGYVGMPRSWVSAKTAFQISDAAPIVGRGHSLTGYLESSTLSSLIATGAVGGLE
jgi:pimeloyl-ACP methyl ester carboxylesterase